MITQETHRIDWHKAAQVTGVVLLALGKAIWWLAKKGGLLLVAVLTVLAKVFVALVSVWASVPDTRGENETESVRPHDSDGLDLSTGLPVKKVL